MNLLLASFAIIVAAVMSSPPLDKIEEAAKRHDFEWFGLTIQDAQKKRRKTIFNWIASRLCFLGDEKPIVISILADDLGWAKFVNRPIF